MRARGAGVLLLATVALAGCDDDRRAISRDDLPAISDEPAVTVEMGDGGFDTEEIEVSTEDVVEFVNTGDEDHGVRTEDSSIDTGLLLPGESTHVVFGEEERYELFDVADDDHTITVVATEPPAAG